MRLSLLPSALADIAAGTVLGAGRWPSGAAPFLLMAGSACVYHGGMALNDWADREADARDGRPRPIPRGEIGAATALGLAALLLVCGPALASLADPRAALCLATVALLASLYDLFVRGPWLGPLLLGACRAGNLASGILLGHAWAQAFASPREGAPIVLATLAALYGCYVFLVSRLARLEDRPEAEIARGGPKGWLLLAALVLGLLGAAGAYATHLVRAPERVRWLGASLAVLLSAWGAWTLLRAKPASGAWRAPDLGRLAGMGLRRLLVATGALAAATGTLHGLVVAGAILCGYPLAFALRRVFPPT